MTDTDRKTWVSSVYDDPPVEDVVRGATTAEMVARRTVGLLLQASQATFDMHAADLIFDYLWLLEHGRPADGPEVTPIWWAHDRHGTSIGQDRDYVAAYRRDGLYKISIPQPIRSRIDIIITREEY